MKKLKVMIVEDDQEIILLLKDFLEDCDFKVDIFNTATDAISNLIMKKYDILLLDINLPDFDGLEVCKKIKNKVAIPIIIISAYNELEIKIKAFKLGVSDYITKPFHLEELEARIWAVLGRNSDIKSTLDNLIFHIEQNTIVFNDIRLQLTSTEFDILSLLIKNKNNLLKRKVLCDTLSSISSQRSLDNHITNIRKKIEKDPGNPQYLKTEYGVGYKLLF